MKARVRQLKRVYIPVEYSSYGRMAHAVSTLSKLKILGINCEPPPCMPKKICAHAPELFMFFFRGC